MNVFIADPGYSLKEAMDKWKINDFPGHALYGVNYFEENGITSIFQENKRVIKEESRGASKLSVLWSRVIAEISLIKEIRRKKNIDAIYVPVMNFALGLCVAKKLKLLSKPVIVCVHSTNYNSYIKKMIYQMCYSNSNQLIFIAKNVYEEFKIIFPAYSEKRIW